MSADGRIDIPVGFGSVLAAIRKRDGETLAQEIFHTLQYAGPVSVPPPKHFSDPKALQRWRDEAAPMPEELQPELVNWIEWNRRRGAAICENERRLRSTTWAQVRLKNIGDYWKAFAEFHREQWGIVRVCEDDVEREQQVRAVARNGVRT